jgi:hypothetical protein
MGRSAYSPAAALPAVPKQWLRCSAEDSTTTALSCTPNTGMLTAPSRPSRLAQQHNSSTKTAQQQHNTPWKQCSTCGPGAAHVRVAQHIPCFHTLCHTSMLPPLLQRPLDDKHIPTKPQQPLDPVAAVACPRSSRASTASQNCSRLSAPSTHSSRPRHNPSCPSWQLWPCAALTTKPPPASPALEVVSLQQALLQSLQVRGSAHTPAHQHTGMGGFQCLPSQGQATVGCQLPIQAAHAGNRMRAVRQSIA